MPELPEVEITCRGILPYVIDRTILSVTVRQPRLRLPIGDDFKQNILTKRINAVFRRAKYIILQLDGGNILIHLGMSGHLKILPLTDPPLKHDHVDILLNNERIIRYTDPRRFGFMQWFPDTIDSHPLLQQLGPEPLSNNFNGDYLHEKATRRSIAIKKFIMDNKVVVGVGNIYATESLFLAGIHPYTPINKITVTQFEILAKVIKQVLLKAIEQGGTTLKDFYHSDGRPGYFSQSLKVYGRAGKACFHCNHTINSMIIGQRNSYFCPNCQH